MRLLSRLMRDSQGATTVEFALLGPVFVTVMLGVLQIGMAMWTYNGLRSVASEVARHAVINYQTSNKLTNVQIKDYTTSVATGKAYGLSHSNLSITVENATTQRVSGATELTLTINYSFPTLLSIIGAGDIPMNFSRPIFLLS